MNISQTASNMLDTKPTGEVMPVLFVGHGSPMNAIADNNFTRSLHALGKKLPRPQTILVVSAHWMTEGTWITAMPQPRTIHDFYGFPKELSEIQYPALGNPELASLVQNSIDEPKIRGDTEQWGLDHGTWSVLRHLYPKADIPVLQLSLDLTQPPEYHIQLGKDLQKLRERGVLILGSGNLVHNLRTIRWESNAKPFDWALEFDEWLKEKLLAGDFESVLKHYDQSPAGKMSVPTLDHYFPVHYILGAANQSEELKFEHEEIQNGSISMRTFSVGFS